MAWQPAPLLATAPDQPQLTAVPILALLPPTAPVMTSAFAAAPQFTSLISDRGVGYSGS